MFGSELELEFQYVGMNIAQYEEGFVMDNNHYVQAVEMPSTEVAKTLRWRSDRIQISHWEAHSISAR